MKICSIRLSIKLVCVVDIFYTMQEQTFNLLRRVRFFDYFLVMILISFLTEDRYFYKIQVALIIVVWIFSEIFNQNYSLAVV